MKKGVSLVSLVVVIIIMVILAGVVVITSTDSMSTAEINSFATEIINIQTLTDEYYYRYEKYPVKDDIVFDITTITSEELQQFETETVTEGKITFKVIDLSAIGITSMQFGKANTTYDIYALSESSGKVYYLQGVEYEEKMYYTLTDELYEMTDIKSNELLGSNNIKKQDVIFIPSSIDYTNDPVTVTVKLPLNATINEITTTNSKSVSEVTTQPKYQVIQVNETSENKDGNYTITVDYTYDGVQKQVKYEVSVFDNTPPVLTVTTKQVEDRKELSLTTTDDLSGVKVVKYEEKEIEDDTHFVNYGKIVNGSKIILGKNSAYTIYIEDNAGNHAKIVSIGESIIPAAWRQNVIKVYNTVPIPKGFVASQATGESTKNGGLVIYEGTEAVTDANVEKARRERNQYVWVPVPQNAFKTTFVRNAYGSSYKLSEVLGVETTYWEVELDENNLPKDTQSDMTYMSTYTLSEIKAMYNSVAKYGGFYLARYEAGVDAKRVGNTAISKGSDVHSKMNMIPYSYIRWSTSAVMNQEAGGAVEVARSVYDTTNANYGVVSTLVYGVQWDVTVQWLKSTGVIDGSTNSTNIGNYLDREITVNDVNDGAKYGLYSNYAVGDYAAITEDAIKDAETAWSLTTGALKAAKLKNIYDMAGNVWEWTMEGCSTDKRTTRGGHFYKEGKFHIGYHNGIAQNLQDCNYGFRIALYIK